MQYTNLIWRNGQPYSEMFDDIYYSPDENETISGENEFKHVFFKNNGLPERWQSADDFVVAELGFGSGLNCLLTIREWLKHLDECKQDKCLHYIALEKFPLSPEAIDELISKYPDLLKKLGKFKTGKGCLYINKIEDIDIKTLKELIKQSVGYLIKLNK